MESAIDESVKAGKEQTMSGDTYFEVMTMGDFALGRKTIRTKVVRPLDDGCFWFAQCEGCGWEGCVTTSIVRYDSEAGRKARGEAFLDMLQAGIRVEWMASFFGLRAEDIERLARDYSVNAGGPKFDPLNRDEVKAEAVRRRTLGVPVNLIASDLGVSSRQVMYWLADAAGSTGRQGVRRSDGNHSRGMVMPARELSEAMQQRVEVLRARFE
jgi:hypothetical protein